MRRLLILEAISTIAGGQRVLLDLLPGLREAFDVTVAIPGPGPLADALDALGVRTIALPIRRFSLVKKTPRDVLAFAASTPLLILALRNLIARDGYDLVYANSTPAFPWGTLGALLAGRPLLWHSHNNLGDAKSLLLVRALAALPVVRRIIGASASAVDQYRQPGKSIVVRSGVDLDAFAPSAEAGRRFRAEHNIDGAEPLFGILGDFIPLKQQDLFLRGMLLAREQWRAAQALIVGSARPNPESQSYRQSLEPLIRQVDARVIPWVDDLNGLLNALDVLVIASTTETGPLVLFQSLACGTPVVSTPVGHAPELLRDGTAGRLYPQGDPNALAVALRAVLSSPSEYAVMQRAARDVAVRSLGLRQTRQKIVELIRAELR